MSPLFRKLVNYVLPLPDDSKVPVVALGKAPKVLGQMLIQLSLLHVRYMRVKIKLDHLSTHIFHLIVASLRQDRVGRIALTTSNAFSLDKFVAATFLSI